MCNKSIMPSTNNSNRQNQKEKAKRGTTSCFAKHRYSDERKLKSRNTRIANKMVIQERISSMFFNFHRDYPKRLVPTEFQYPYILRDFCKELAIHYWHNFQNPSHTSSKMMIRHIENMLGLGCMLFQDQDKFMKEEIALGN